MSYVEIKIGNKVTSHLSLWKGDVGVVAGFMSDSNELVFVIFHENDKHYTYQQTLNKKDLMLWKNN